MFTLCIVLLSPSVMLLTARLFSRQRAASRRLVAVEWLVDAAVLLSLTLLLFCPVDRVAVSPWTGHPLSFVYGKTAAMFSLLAGAALGVLQGLRRFRWEIEPSARKPRPLGFLLRLPLHLFAFALLVLTVGYLWGIEQYPIVSMEEIVFHLNAPLEGTGKFFTSDVLVSVALPVAALLILFELLIWLPGPERSLVLRGAGFVRIRLAPPRRISFPLALLFLCGLSSLLFSCLDRYLDLSTFIRTHLQSSELIEREYVDPATTALVFPSEKRNLINIYIESGETTYQDRSNGGIADINYTPEQTRIAAENVSFSQSDLLQGAAIAPGSGWTTSGLIAQTSGLPLKVLTSVIGGQMSSVLPGTTSLGDILREHGYRNVFMAGSDFTFGGRRQYFDQHGGYEVWDLLTARETGLLDEDYYEAWGFEDRKLYAYAMDMLTELSQSDQPFHFCLLTIDTHTPGFTFDCCPDGIDNPYLRAVACSSRQLDAFIAWCQQQPFYENTTIVITGDHACMLDPQHMGLSTESNDIYFGSTDRLVYNAFVNAAAQPAREKNRLFTTMDFFPSVLASIGVSIEGERLGLGTNLFSERDTLAEEYGYDELFSELSKLSTFYNERLLYP